MDGALEGIRVLDLTHVGAGPMCGMMLSDMGAEVIKIEPPGRGDMLRTRGTVFLGETSASFISLNRNKKSVTLDMRQDRGRELALELAARCDVLVENWRPGVVGRLGLGYEVVSARSPRLVFCSISAFGQSGPYRDKPGLDPIVQAIGGIMGITGPRDGEPVLVGAPIVDMGSAVMASYAIVLALYARERTGRGQKVEVALLNTLLTLMSPREGEYFATGEPLRPSGHFHRQLAPYRAFKTRDHYIYIANLGEERWASLCRVLGLEHLATDPRFDSNDRRVRHRAELNAMLEPVLLTRSTVEWVQLLEAVDVLCAPINNSEQLFSDPQVRHNQMVVSMEHPEVGEIRVLGTPVKLSGTPGRPRTPPPTLGQHTGEVLGGLLGLSAADLELLRTEGIV